MCRKQQNEMIMKIKPILQKSQSSLYPYRGAIIDNLNFHHTSLLHSKPRPFFLFSALSVQPHFLYIFLSSLSTSPLQAARGTFDPFSIRHPEEAQLKKARIPVPLSPKVAALYFPHPSRSSTPKPKRTKNSQNSTSTKPASSPTTLSKSKSSNSHPRPH